MLRPKTLEEVGGFDDKIFMYFEDVELCYRMKQAGWKIFYYPDAEIFHFRGQSSRLKQQSLMSPLSTWGTKQYTTSVIYFYNKHFKTAKTFMLRILIVLTSLFKALVYTTAGIVSGKISEIGGRAKSYLAMIPTACKFSLRKKKGNK